MHQVPPLKPGDIVQLTNNLSFGELVVLGGACAFIVSIPTGYDPVNWQALVLVNDRLVRVPDWWLRKNSVLLVG